MLSCTIPVLVSWACAMSSPLTVPRLAFPRLTWVVPSPASWPRPNETISGEGRFGLMWISVGFSGRLPVDTPPLMSAAVPGQPIRAVQQGEVRAGWPFHALVAQIAGEARATDDNPAAMQVAPRLRARSRGADVGPVIEFDRTWRAGLRLGDARPGGARALGHVIPVVPLWGGLLANIALTAAIIMPIPLAREIRRARRRRAHQCPDCSHQLLENQTNCPECGSRTPRDGAFP